MTNAKNFEKNLCQDVSLQSFKLSTIKSVSYNRFKNYDKTGFLIIKT